MSGNGVGGFFCFYCLSFFAPTPHTHFFPPVPQLKVYRALHKKNILPYDLNNLANSQEYVILIATKVNAVNGSWFFLYKPAYALESYYFKGDIVRTGSVPAWPGGPRNVANLAKLKKWIPKGPVWKLQSVEMPSKLCSKQLCYRNNALLKPSIWKQITCTMFSSGLTQVKSRFPLLQSAWDRQPCHQNGTVLGAQHGTASAQDHSDSPAKRATANCFGGLGLMGQDWRHNKARAILMEICWCLLTISAETLGNG